MSVDVRPVSSRSEVRRFIELPFRLHSSSPYWCPPLRVERHMFLSRRQNAFFEHGDARLFCAWRDGEVVGRISAQVDRAYNDFHASRTGMFGFLELEDDPEILPALLEAAEAWLRARGCEEMLGPADFTWNDESGVLVEGHELEPMIRQPWHPRYYQARCEEAGLEKEIDLWMWELDISDRASIRPIIFRLAEEAEPRHGVRIRKMTRRSLRRDMDGFADVYNSAWSHNWGFRPYGKADLDWWASELQLAFDGSWLMIAERGEETVAAAITVPDMNQVLRKMNGRLLPFGWWHFLRRRRIIDRCRVGFLGVKPEYQHTGVAAALYVEHFDMAAVHRIKHGEMGWILETNRAMNRGMEAMNGDKVKTYRVYRRPMA